ncbi:MAG: hypothetical protein ACKVOH_02885 [Chlamydiales bacterium]
MKKSIDAGGSSRAYLMIQFTFSFFVMILLNPVRTHTYGWSTSSMALGLIGGVLLGIFMWGLGKTLEKGPPGLSLAILNSSSVMPAVVLLVLFGVVYGHTYNLWNAVGSLFVVGGILWAGWTSEKNPNKKSWIFFMIFVFLLHVAFLVYLQWWAMILHPSLPLSRVLPFHIATKNVQWFMPAVFFAAAIFQWIVYLKNEDRLPNRSEVVYGFMGGVTNAACTFFLILAPQVATAWQNAMLFPIYSVCIILFCNFWAQILYKERVNGVANTVCVFGLILGTVAWSNF